ncbi:Suppressor of fused protein (SUFU) [Corynebacterium kutscheri]|uniref:Suppressor of fused protein (SUFU) n=1 Tax=Corynebacterium kutscheri TaxID=35755 RepID=A0A0F6TBY5_9CORY|nr:suppressor of fused domain protein [Corynebacterium kutscheri]AKE40379.1 Suppressor of fused protein (SUFU) [Corynebacterium kutscheri]VEH10774.1 Suppressor of fused protein (SUFU) [Corynebacterium kutscheri]VEH80747.1 Suppressor of fused protein (SUFU) [Corynebacterium kutscheri]
MRFEETALWLDNLVPAAMVIHEPIGGTGFKVASFNLGAETFAATVEFNHIDTGLEAQGKDVRSELISVAKCEAPIIVGALNAAASIFAEEPRQHAMPGALVAGIIERAGLAEQVSVRHGLFVAPFMWGKQVPQFDEPKQLTVLLHMLMLTQDEYDYATTYGVAELQKEMLAGSIDLNNWAR